jgi:hypothetical protein
VPVALAASSLLIPTVINPLPPRNPPDTPTHPAGIVSRSAVCMHCRLYALPQLRVLVSHIYLHMNYKVSYLFVFFLMVQQHPPPPPLGQGLLIIEAL